eukprot:COSAG02_NODE_10527_length_1922_cov_1.007131_2_plen_74_part_00
MPGVTITFRAYYRWCTGILGIGGVPSILRIGGVPGILGVGGVLGILGRALLEDAFEYGKRLCRQHSPLRSANR